MTLVLSWEPEQSRIIPMNSVILQNNISCQNKAGHVYSALNKAGKLTKKQKSQFCTTSAKNAKFSVPIRREEKMISLRLFGKK